MSIAENIKRIRESHGMSQAELGKIAGVSDKAVSTWENGLKTPRMGAIQKIADYFGISKSDIIEDTSVHEIPHAKYRELLSEGGFRLLLDTDANVPQDHIEDIVEFIKFKQRKNGR